ncbi:MAG: MgtC/SapB family protein [Desulfobacteraceae bacterium]|nr:MgtC/SapB family protein [Desulfobacteraceae bacterium]
MLEKQLFEVFTHLMVAMLAGGLIGLERSYNGHAAGFRTHTLVCMASTLLMIIAIYQKDWFSQALVETVRIDPTRMAQGVMTGIGFLGAGVIMREGLSIRGLTTAASIWITSAIGILVGVGFYGAVFIVLALTLGTLSIFRLVEARLPSLMYAHCSLRLNCGQPISERDIRNLMAGHGFDVINLSYSLLKEEGQCLTYGMTIRTRKQQHFERLAQELSRLESILEFRISFTD